MDSDSDYDRDTESPSPTDFASIQSFVQALNEFQRRDQMENIERLTLENLMLQHLVANYQRHWCLTIELAEKVYKAVVSIEEAITKCIDENITAEYQWLAIWGINGRSTSNKNYTAAGWI